ncbi:zinc finger protein, PHD-type [Pelomyxa schiedti]|nr:zinc finger protein, PHD-type [Pelomyxa schiedti]
MQQIITATITTLWKRGSEQQVQCTVPSQQTREGPKVFARRTHSSEVPDDLLQLRNLFDIPVEDLTETSLNDLNQEITRLCKKNSQCLLGFPIPHLVSWLQNTCVNLLHTATPKPYSSSANELAITEDVMCAVQMGLAAMTIMAADSMPAAVIVEEVIEQTLTMVKNVSSHLFAVIDPTSTNDTGDKPKGKEKFRKIKKSIVSALSNKIVAILDVFSSFLLQSNITDNCILLATSTCMNSFVVDGADTIHLSAMKTVRNVFCRYPRHRKQLFEELIASLKNLPKWKLTHSTFRLKDSNETIHIMSAVALQLIQWACVPSTRDSVTLASVGAMQFCTFEGSVLCCQDFVSNIFSQFCSASKEGESIMKAVVDMLVNDLLCTLNSPEWPASELMLQVFTHLAINSLSKNSSPTNAPLSASMRLFLMDALSTIAVKLKKELLLTSQFVVSPKGEEYNEGLCPHCSASFDSLMIQCDECCRFFHGTCSGINVNEAPAEWICGDCEFESTIKQMWEDFWCEHSSHPEDEIPEIGHEDILRISLVTHMQARTQTDPCLLFSSHFYLGQWFPASKLDSGSSDRREFFQKFLKYQEEIQHVAVPGLPNLRRERIIEVTRYFASSRALHQNVDLIISCLVKPLSDTAIRFRAASIKALSLLATVDPSVIANAWVKTAIQKCLTDTAPSVRSATLELVSKHLLHNNDVMNLYFPSFSNLSKDNSVSVRKRVVQICQSVCMSNPLAPIVKDICTMLVKRTTDVESSIRAHVLEIFQSLWFSSESEDIQILTAKCDQILSVVSSGDHDWLVELLKQVFSDKASDVATKVCAGVCKFIVQRIISLLEEAHQEDQANIVSCFEVLYTITQANPLLLVPHLTALHPFLKSDNKLSTFEQRAVAYVADILDILLPSYPHPSATIINEIECDLVLQIYAKKGVRVVGSCAKCLCTIVSKVSLNYRLLEEIFLRFYMFLKDHATGTSIGIQRSLYILGTLCKYFNFNERGILQTIKAAPQQKQTPPLVSKVPAELGAGGVHKAMLKITLVFLKSDSVDVSPRAAHMLGCILTQWPVLSNIEQVKAELQKLLTSSSSLTKDAALLVLSDILVASTKPSTTHGPDNHLNAQSDATPAKCESDPGAIDAVVEDGLGSGTTLPDVTAKEPLINASIVTSNLHYVSAMLLDSKDSTRASALGVFKLAIKSGSTNPLSFLGNILALVTDDPPICEKALEIIDYIQEFFPDFILNRLAEGFKQSYLFQRKVLGTVRVAIQQSQNTICTLFGRVYSHITKKSKHQFLSVLLDSFDKPPENEILAYCKYLAETAALLPYRTHDEPLFVVAAATRHIMLRGQSVLSEMKASIAEEDIQYKPHLAIPILCLLDLRHFLKSSYNLTESRCKNYSEEADSKEDKAELIYQIELNHSTPPPVIQSDLECGEAESLLEYCQRLYKKLKTSLSDEDITGWAQAKPKRRRTSPAVRKPRVTKPRATTTTRRVPAKRARKPITDDDEDEEYQPDNDEDDTAVQSPVSDGLPTTPTTALNEVIKTGSPMHKNIARQPPQTAPPKCHNSNSSPESQKPHQPKSKRRRSHQTTSTKSEE